MKVFIWFCIIAVFTTVSVAILASTLHEALYDALHGEKMMSFKRFWRTVAHSKEIKLVDLAYLITGAALWGWLLYVMVYAITMAIKKIWEWL